MSSLLERMNISASTGPLRSKSKPARSASAPYSRENRTRKGDVDGQWSHDLYESHNSLSARLNIQPGPPKASLNAIAQKAIQEAANASASLSIKGASTQGNVVEVGGLVEGTTPADVASIFKRCGVVTDQKLVSSKASDVRVRITFKTPQSAQAAVSKFHNQTADGKVLSVKIVGTSATGTSLAGRLGGADGLDLVRGEGSVDVLMNGEGSTSGSKMRSDSLLKTDPRAHVLVAPPGANPADYVAPTPGTHARGGKRGRGGRRGRRGGNGIGARMDLD